MRRSTPQLSLHPALSVERAGSTTDGDVLEFYHRRDRATERGSLDDFHDCDLPGGPPQIDVLDYAVDELARSVRNAEMALERVRDLAREHPRHVPPELVGTAEFIARGMTRSAEMHGPALLRLRRMLGIYLGPHGVGLGAPVQLVRDGRI